MRGRASTWRLRSAASRRPRSSSAPTAILRGQITVDVAQIGAALIGSVNRDVPLYHIHTLDDLVSTAAATPRFTTLLLSSFAVMALLLSAVGLYAVLSYMVAQRTNEMGLRMALGAQRGDVLKLILKRGLVLAGIGVMIGLGASAVLTRFISSQIYGVHAFDPVTYIVVTGLLTAISLLASAAPAWRAARVDPMKTLREQ